MDKKFSSSELKNVVSELNVNLETGLSSEEAKLRLSQYGPNKLAEEKPITYFSVALEEIREPMILLLFAVGIIYSIWGKLEDAITIFVVILILVFVEVFTEFRAKKSINALKQLSEPSAAVFRDSEYKEIPTSELVPGDIIILKMGQRIPADARLSESYGLMADESMLTGESVPSAKDASLTAPENAQPADIKNIVFAGSIITQGRGRAVVVGTGMKTELGKITGMVQAAKIEKTPLQKLMKELTKWMVWVALFFSITIPLIGIAEGQPWKEMILTGLALSFATIPEELPIVITMVLALGSFSLSRQDVLVKKLDAAETIGAVTVICADKTGTLTENRMKVKKIFSSRKLKDFDNEDEPSMLLEADRKSVV